jgi:glyoxylase-like metal-dependent hydrolase (beta-lactamase superfamily II)
MSRLVPAFNPGPLTGRGNNTWLLDGAEPALIDAGIGRAEHVDGVAAALGGRTLVRVFVTHGHSDHASGAPALRARWPGVELHKWALPGETDFLPLSDGQRVRAGDRDLEVVHTPGHALDHVCFWDAAARELYAGDMLALGTTIVVPGERGGGMRAYLASLDRMAALSPARIYPGHGDIIERPLDLIAEFIEHRRLRERQVLACLDAGVTDLDAMVARIYPALAEALRPSARQTVEAHLGKLRAEGRIMIPS